MASPKVTKISIYIWNEHDMIEVDVQNYNICGTATIYFDTELADTDNDERFLDEVQTTLDRLGLNNSMCAYHEQREPCSGFFFIDEAFARKWIEAGYPYFVFPSDTITKDGVVLQYLY